MILEIRGPEGAVVWKAPQTEGTKAISPQAAFLVSDILAGNTDKAQNPIWAEKLALNNGKGGGHRPAAVKTGTANDARDLATYGYLATPAKPDQPALVVGVWMGNSDHSNPRSKRPAISLTAAAPLWRAFVRDYSSGWPVAKFKPPKGVVTATIDAWTGGKPGPWTRQKTRAWFIDGTQPGARNAIDPDGLLYSRACGGYRVDPLKAELGPTAWDQDVADWLRRARSGPGRVGRYDSRTAYFWKQSSWGGPLIGGCAPREDRTRDRNGHDNGDKGKGKGKPGPTAPPAPVATPVP
jgi:membrane peptidoglycan carboxypeptidase